MFTCCKDGGSLEVLLENTKVISAKVERKTRTMTLHLAMLTPAAPVEISMIEDGIAAEFGLSKVEVLASYPRLKVEKKPVTKDGRGEVIMGKPNKSQPIPMKDVHLDLGKVTVRGEVFDVQTREIPKINAWVLTFDMTDCTGSVHVQSS